MFTRLEHTEKVHIDNTIMQKVEIEGLVNKFKAYYFKTATPLIIY